MTEKFPRTDSTQAMKSIFSAYGDDEEAVEEPPQAPSEDYLMEGNISGSDDEDSTTRSLVSTPVKVEQRAFEHYKESPLVHVAEPVKKVKTGRKATRLVSYGPEEEEEEDDLEEEEEGEEAEAEEEMETEQAPADNDGLQEHATEATEQSLESKEDDIPLPPEPPGKCSKQLQEKIRKHYEKMMNGNADLIQSIKARKHFRNPSIYEKLLEFCEIDEKGTNYPPDLYNPSIWNSSSYYDELAKVQNVEMEKRAKEKKERTKVEFVTGTKKSAPEGEPKRKSKWDTQPAVTASIPNPPVVSVTTSVTGHKTTVISAVGTIKKPK